MQTRTASKILRIIGAILCLSIPNLDDYNGLSVWYILYVVVFLLFNVAVYVWSVMGKVEVVYLKLTTNVCLDAMSSAILMLNVVVYVVYAIFVKRRSIVEITKKLTKIEEDFQEKLKFYTTESEPFPLKTVLGLLIGIALFFITETFIIYKTTSTASNWVKYGYESHFHVFITSIFVLQIYELTQRIKTKLVLLNNCLYIFVSETNKSGDFGHETLNVVRFFLKTYDDLCDVIEMVSDSYGIQMLFFVWLCIVEIIFYVNFGFKLGSKIHANQTTPGDIQKNNVIYSYLILLLWCLLFTVSTNPTPELT